jgi:hypothetical protein
MEYYYQSKYCKDCIILQLLILDRQSWGVAKELNKPYGSKL